jgi:tetratricopeptide (TPR) repeat protein
VSTLNLRIVYILLTLIAFTSCKSKEKTAGNGNTSDHKEPDQLSPQVNTEFQEAFFTAQLEKAKGNETKAYAAFENCLAINPKSAAIHYELGKFDLKNNNTSMALEHAKTASSTDPNNAWYQLLLGDTYMAIAKYPLATKAYKEVVRLNPNDPNILYQIATSQLYEGKAQDAIDTYDQLEKQVGPYEELSMQKHKLYLELKQTDKAGKELEDLARAYPTEPRYWGRAAQFYQSIGNVEKAKSAMDEMIKSDPSNGMVHLQLSEFYAAEGNDEKSYQELKLAFNTTDLTIDQKMGVLLKYYSLTNANKQYLPQAYELLDLTVKNHPKEAKAYSIYGDFFYRDMKDKEARDMYKKSVELDPSKNIIWTQLLAIETSLNLTDETIADSKQAMELFPNQPEYYLYNGIAHQRKKNYSKAIESLAIGKELVIENDKMLSQFYSSLGECYHYLNDHLKSDESFEQSLKLDKDNVFTMNNYAYYLSLRKVKLDKAEEMASRANQLSPGNTSFEDTYGWILYQKGNYAEAVNWLKKAIEHGGSTSGEVLEHLGDALYRQGNVQGALEQWKAAQNAGGGSSQLTQKISQQKIID